MATGFAAGLATCRAAALGASLPFGADLPAAGLALAAGLLAAGLALAADFFCALGGAFLAAGFFAAGRTGFLPAGLAPAVFLPGLAARAAFRAVAVDDADFALVFGLDLREGCVGFLAMVILESRSVRVVGPGGRALPRRVPLTLQVGPARENLK